MARIQYAPGVTPITKEHCGCTFQSGRAANTMSKAQANDRNRNGKQNNKKIFLINATNHWRTLSPGIKAAWSNFAATYPQPTKRNPLVSLSGYQNFIKRAYYLFLNYGIGTIFDEPPLMQALTVDPVTFSIDQSENCIDCSTAYIANFGMLPKAGDILLLRVIPMAVSSGQYFEPIEEPIECTAVYIDGLFLSLHFPSSRENIVYSIFLSKPVNPSISYIGTKTRYMGCFTSKKFIDLSDTPKTYVGQAGKVATVNPAEDGLIFSTPSSGGITCADLPSCSKIISMDSLSTSILNLLIQSQVTSSIPINFGNLYNWKTVTDAKSIAPLGTRVLTQNDWQAIQTGLGGQTSGGCYAKDQSLQFWSSFRPTSLNTLKLNWRGNGLRSTSGAFSNMYANGYCWSSTQYDSTQAYAALCVATDDTFKIDIAYKGWGLPIRLVRNDQKLLPIIGNDGTIYRVARVGSLVITADNIIETKFRDGSLIPFVTDNAIWAANAGPMSCYYLNLQSYSIFI